LPTAPAPSMTNGAAIAAGARLNMRVGATLPVTPIPALRPRFSAPPDRVKPRLAGKSPLMAAKSITY
jgi:hypothetical protein